MVVVAKDPITGIAIGKAGTTGSGRQTGIKTKPTGDSIFFKRQNIREPDFEFGFDPQVVSSEKTGRSPRTFEPSTVSEFDLQNLTGFNAQQGFGGPSGPAGGPSGDPALNPGLGYANIRPPGAGDPGVGAVVGGATPGLGIPPFNNVDDVSQFALPGPAIGTNSAGQPIDVEGNVTTIPPTFDPEEGGTPTIGAFGASASLTDAALNKLNDFSLRGNVDSEAMRSWIASLIDQEWVIVDIVEDPNSPGTFYAITNETDPATGEAIFHTNTELNISALDTQAAEIAAATAQLEQDRFALEEEISGEQLRIQEQIARIDQDIARDRIQADQETAAGNWQNALDIRDRVDASERAQRQLERDLFNAEQELNNRRFELERASFDLQKLEFFQPLSQTPANFADLFNLSRGLPPVGAGGPLPQGVQRVAGPSDVQQTAAQDFRLSGIDLGVNAASGALPTLKGEGAAPTFDPSQTQLSFLAGGDPTPVDLAGLPPAAPGAGVGNIGGGGETSAIFNAEQGGVTGDAPPAVPFAPPGEVVEDLNAVPVAPQTVVNTDALTSAGVNAPMQQPITTETLTPTQGGPTTAVDPQGAPLPPGLQIAFGGGLPGAPQTLPNSVPLLSPQQLAQLTPAEREAYFSIAQMQGQFLPDYQNLLAARGAPTEYQGSQRVFA